MEKVSAIMITGKDRYHERFARKSVENFHQQTYQNKSLLIVNDGEYSLKDLECSIVRELRLKDKKHLTQLRNIGLEMANTDFVIQWDDDDWRVPELIEKQLVLLLKSGKKACFLKTQLRYSFLHNSAYVFSWVTGVWGTILHKKNDTRYPYPPAKGQKDSDVAFAQKFDAVVLDNLPWYYIRFFHGHNAWGAEHFGFQVDKWNVGEETRKYLQKVIEEYKEVI